ncbi:MAG: hypothetical protein WD069_08580 [Planctomycetales bacterium]
MAKQKSTGGGKPVRKAVKKSAQKSPARKTSPAKKTSSGNSTPRATKVVKRPVAKKRSAAAQKSAARRKTLGRPRVPGDARLDLVFQKDYQAREVFEFLGVSTVRELERFGPDEIIRRLTSPMVQTVGRIRKALAVANRSLADDTEFALEFRDQYMSDR